MMRLLVAVTLLAMPLSLSACSCVAQTIEEAFDAATHAFIARIASVRAVPMPDKAVEIRWEDTLVQHSRFTVVEAFKGHPRRIAELRSGFGHGDCGVALVAGMDYLVLVGDDGIVSYCSGVFGPHYGWNDKSLFRSERREQLDRFTASVRAHYASRAKIARPPPGELGIEDDATRWLEDEVADPSSDCAKHH